MPQSLEPDYKILTGRDWPLNAKQTFQVAMALTRAERENLLGSPARSRPSAAGVAHEAAAAAPAPDGSLFDIWSWRDAEISSY